MAVDLLGLDSTKPYDFIAGFGLGIALGDVILGIIFTSRYTAKIKAFKMRLLHKA